METIVTIVFFLVLTVPGSQPATFHEPAATLDECLDEVRNILSKMSPSLKDGGTVQAGCVIRAAPSVEN